LLSDIGLIWAGMIVHIAISWYKGFRQNGAQVPRSATRILYLISAREMAIWVAILVGAALGYALVLTGHIAQAGPIFAIGYSMDSLVDALVPRFNTSLLQIAKALPAA
jgi:tryptophan-rich sensory protein